MGVSGRGVCVGVGGGGLVSVSVGVGFVCVLRRVCVCVFLLMPEYAPSSTVCLRASIPCVAGGDGSYHPVPQTDLILPVVQHREIILRGKFLSFVATPSLCLRVVWLGAFRIH